MVLCVFIFIFLFRNNVVRELLNENNFCRCYVFFLFETIIPRVLDHNDVQCFLSTITRHLDKGIWKTSYNWRFYQHRSQACTKTFNLLLHVCSLYVTYAFQREFLTQLNHLASLAKWLSVHLWTMWLWVRVQLWPLIIACFSFFQTSPVLKFNLMLVKQNNFCHNLFTFLIFWPPPPLLKEWGIDLTKNPKKRGMKKLLKGREDPKKGGFC